jgi:hypothetical protein
MGQNTTEGKPDPFDDLEGMRCNAEDYAVTGGATDVLTAVSTKRPSKHVWFRIHPDPACSMNTTVFKYEIDSEFYFVTEPARRFIADLQLYTLYLGVTLSGGVFFWPVPLPSPDGFANIWHLSAHEAARTGMQSWVRVTTARDRSRAGYICQIPTSRFASEPKWPDPIDMRALLRLAFSGRVIDGADHPVVRALQGAAVT